MYIHQALNIFTPEECDLILNQRIEDSFDGEKVNDLLVFKDEAKDEWANIFTLVNDKTRPVVDKFLDSFLSLLPKHIVDISHIGFLNDNFGSFTEIHYDWEMVIYKDKIIPKPFVMLIYLNDDFEGGELLFPLQKYRTVPEQGSVVIFPCNFSFPHVSQPVTKGSKHVCRITYTVDVDCYKVDELEI